MPQNFANHRHNSPIFIVAAISTVTALVMLGMAALGFGRLHLASTFGLLIVSVICLCLMSRQYATALQDRIIKMEMRYRTDKFLSDDQRKVLWGLTKRQIVALRFASNAEMPALIDRAVKENLSGADIKKAVKDWQADFDRT